MNEIIRVALQADVGGFVSGMAKADSSLERVGVGIKGLVNVGKAAKGAVDAVGETVEKAGRRIRLWGIGGLATIGAWGIVASQFEGRMRNVNSLLGLSEQQFTKFSDSTLRFASDFPQSINESADALYNIVSSGFENTSDASKILQASLRAASAGMTSTDVAAMALDTSINAYGLSVSDVNDISDILFQTVNKGVLNFEELSVGMGDWVAMAASAGVPLDQAASALAAITLSGVPAAEASTSLARALQAFIDPGKSMTEVIHGLGFESGQAMLQQLGFRGSVLATSEAVGGNTQAIIKLYEDIRAGRGALALLTNGGQNYARVAGAIENKTARAGATQRAFNAQAEGAAFKFKQVVNAGQELSVMFGTGLLPPAKVFFDFLLHLRTMLESIPAPIKALAAGGVASFGLMSVALGSLLAYAGKSMVMSFVMNRVSAGLASGAVRATAFGRAGRIAGGGLDAMSVAAGKAGGSMIRFGAGVMREGIRHVPPLNAAVNRLNLGMATVGGVVGGAIAVWEVYNFVQGQVRQETASVDAEITKMLGNIDTSNLQELNGGLTIMRRRLNEATEQRNQDFAGGFFGDFGTVAKSVVQGLTPLENTVMRHKINLEETGTAYDQLFEAQRRLSDSGSRLSEAVFTKLSEKGGDLSENLHFTRDEAIALAEAVGVDLSQGGTEGQKALDKTAEHAVSLIETLGKIPAKAGLNSEEYKKALAKAEKATQSFLDDVNQAFGQYSVVEQFGQDFFSDKDQKFSLKGVRQFYTTAVKTTTDFENDLRSAIEAGFDPAFISRIMTAGPKEAGALLHGIVGDQKAEFVDLINNSEALLARLAGQAVEMARLIHKAQTSGTDTAARDLPVAMRIQQANFAAGRQLNDAELSRQLGLPRSQVRHIGKEFGITMPVNFSIGDAPPNAGQAMWRKLHRIIDQVAPLTNLTSIIAQNIEREPVGTGGLNKLDPKFIRRKIEESFRAEHIKIPQEATLNLLVKATMANEAARELTETGMEAHQIDYILSLLGTADAGSKLLKYQSQLNLTPEQLYTAMHVLGDEAGMTKVKQFVAWVAGVPPQDIQVQLDAKGQAHFFKSKKDMVAGVHEIDLANAAPKVDMNKDDFDRKERLLWIKIANLRGAGITIPIRANITTTTPRKGRGAPAPVGQGPAQGAMYSFADGGMYYANKPLQRPVPAHMATAPSVLYGEPETQGESYIPHKKSARGVQILRATAHLFGMDLVQMAAGGYVGAALSYVQGRESYVQGLAGSRGGAPSFANAAALAGAGIEDPAERAKAVHDALVEVARAYQEVEEVAGHSAAEQLAASGLTGQAFSDAAQKLKDIGEQEKAYWTDLPANLFEVGKISSRKYLGYLRERMSHTRKFSSEWMDAWNEINRVEDENEQKRKDHADKVKNFEQNKYEAGRVSTQQYLASLQKQLKGLKAYSDEWMDVRNKIKDIKDAFEEPVRSANSLVDAFRGKSPHGFAEIKNFLAHTTQATKTFNNDLKSLQKGGLNKNLLKELAQAGPEATPLLEAILQGGRSGIKLINKNQQTVADLARQTAGIAIGPTGRGATTYHSHVKIDRIIVGEGSNITARQVKRAVHEGVMEVMDEVHHAAKTKKGL